VQLKWRSSLCILALSVVAGSDAATAGRGPLVVVVNRADEQVTIFKVEGHSLTPLKTLPAGRVPREVCLSPDGARAYVSNQKGKSVTVVDLDSLSIAGTIEHDDLDGPDGCVVSPDSRTLYVVSMARDSLFAISTADYGVVAEIPLPLKVPRRVVVAPDSKRLFVGCNQTPRIAVVDIAERTVAATFDVGNEARGGLAFTPDGKTFLAGNVEDDTVSWVNVETLTVERVVGTPISPQRIEVSPDGAFAYVLTRFGTGLFAMPLKKKHDASRVVPLGKAPWGLAMNPDGTLLYATNNGDDNILVVDAASFQVVANVPAGKDPNGIAYRP
jgi:YVTN family beta-propeller protein